MVWTDVSRHQNGSATIGAGTGAPPLALEGRRAVGSGAGTNYVGATRARSICVGTEK